MGALARELCGVISYYMVAYASLVVGPVGRGLGSVVGLDGLKEGFEFEVAVILDGVGSCVVGENTGFVECGEVGVVEADAGVFGAGGGASGEVGGEFLKGYCVGGSGLEVGDDSAAFCVREDGEKRVEVVELWLGIVEVVKLWLGIGVLHGRGSRCMWELCLRTTRRPRGWTAAGPSGVRPPPTRQTQTVF